MNVDVVRLWVFPREDFERWRDECGAPEGVETYDDYRRLLLEVAETCESRGLATEGVEMTVAEMMRRLVARGDANTTESRARILADPGITLGLRIGPEAIGWAAVAPREGRHSSEAVRPGETHVDATRRILDQAAGL